MTESFKYVLFCTNCSYKRLTNGTDLDDLVVYKRSSLQTAFPKWDADKKKTVKKPNVSLPKHFKCPGCGHLIIAKKTK